MSPLSEEVNMRVTKELIEKHRCGDWINDQELDALYHYYLGIRTALLDSEYTPPQYKLFLDDVTQTARALYKSKRARRPHIVWL